MFDLGRRVSVTAALLLAPLLTFAQDRASPTDVDLKTSYCMGVVESRIADWRQMTSQETDESLKALLQGAAASLENDLNRLKSYIVPKIGYLDATGLIAAKNRGYADYRDSSQQRTACGQRCPTSGLTRQNMDKWNRCFDSCQAERPAFARTKSCERIDWLPF